MVIVASACVSPSCPFVSGAELLYSCFLFFFILLLWVFNVSDGLDFVRRSKTRCGKGAFYSCRLPTRLPAFYDQGKESKCRRCDWLWGEDGTLPRTSGRVRTCIPGSEEPVHQYQKLNCRFPVVVFVTRRLGASSSTEADLRCGLGAKKAGAPNDCYGGQPHRRIGGSTSGNQARDGKHEF